MAKRRKKKPIHGYRKEQVIPVTFSLLLLALFAFFNSNYSNITGMSFVGNVVDKSQMVIYNDSGILLLIVSFAVLLIITGSILIPKYIKNVGVILNALAAIIFLITIIDVFSYKMINLRLIGNFLIGAFLLGYGVFIMKKHVSIG